MPFSGTPLLRTSTAETMAAHSANSSCLPGRHPSINAGEPQSPGSPRSRSKFAIPSLSNLSSLGRQSKASGPMSNNVASAVLVNAATAAEASLSHDPVSPAYEELLVLVHGLQGTVEDFTYFKEKLSSSSPAVAGELLVHATDVNTDKTHDGVVEGGTRLAEDIKRVADEHSSLRRISLVGFSLGGIYVRYAIGILFDRDTSLVAGLTPNNLITVASPNLGVRSFGVYRFIPQPVLDVAAKTFLGKTVEQLVLNDSSTDPLLLRMTTDDNSDSIPFMAALSCFSKRVAYGNLRQDFMVNWGTSVMDASIHGIVGKDLEEAIRERATAALSTSIDHAYDAEHCKVAFSYTYPITESPAGDGRAREERQSSARERVMATRLQALGWKVIGVDFPSLPVPIAHNRIMAMSRGKIHTWMNQAGRRAVLHIVDTLVEGYDSHVPLFERVTRTGASRTEGGRRVSSETPTVSSDLNR